MQIVICILAVFLTYTITKAQPTLGVFFLHFHVLHLTFKVKSAIIYLSQKACGRLRDVLTGASSRFCFSRLLLEKRIFWKGGQWNAVPSEPTRVSRNNGKSKKEKEKAE